MDCSLLPDGGKLESLSKVGGVRSDAEVLLPLELLDDDGAQEHERIHNVD